MDRGASLGRGRWFRRLADVCVGAAPCALLDGGLWEHADGSPVNVTDMLAAIQKAEGR